MLQLHIYLMLRACMYLQKLHRNFPDLDNDVNSCNQRTCTRLELVAHTWHYYSLVWIKFPNSFNFFCTENCALVNARIRNTG